MWKHDAEDSLTAGFDSTIATAFGNGEKGELENLANLFSPRAIAGYRDALLSGLNPSCDAAIDVAWIDKRPIAYLKEDETGAELGDMMLVIHKRSADGHLRESRACLLEVKQSTEDPIKPVPVTSNESTLNQFAILSEWPPLYGLKTTGRNSAYLLKDIKTKPTKTSTGAIPEAWYVAVKPKPQAGVPASDPWMAAPAVGGASFEHTLGNLFQAFVQAKPLHHPTILDVDVGREYVTKHSGNAPHTWDELVTNIIWVAKKYNLPKSLFKKRGTRYRSGTFRSSSYMALVGMNGFAWKPLIAGVTVGFVVAWLIAQAFFKRKLRRTILMHLFTDGFEYVRQELQRKREIFPVLIFQVYDGEDRDGPSKRQG
ncbi:hypothetical protein [Paraburkholderia domus]|uniref:hypothetical protein n=1 Tax=Paraburkholderia domus TaxID=2793075 RepID=UPI001B011B35|nr:hypothetical protein [Paraburkholderia domus]CAE6696532.1 hypothetical protein R75483_00620 [Paraburkholderia domus]